MSATAKREIGIGLLRRLLGGGRPNTSAEIQPEAADEAADRAMPDSASGAPEEPNSAPPIARPSTAASCPYCAALLDPVPERGRLCPRCRRRIVVRRVEGRLVLLTEEALGVFESERDRETKERTWTIERRGWLALATGVSAPVKRVERMLAAPPSEAVVAASKDLYLAGAERAVITARRAKHWDEVASIRRQQAAALYRASGSPVPPPEELVELHRAWSTAALRSLAAYGGHVELVAAGCCAVCNRDNGRAFFITAELRGQRLPHPDCPKGLCPCDWWPLPDTAPRKRRVRRRASPGGGPL